MSKSSSRRGKPNRSSSSSGNRRSAVPFNHNRVLLHAVMLVGAFYAGLMTGMRAKASSLDCGGVHPGRVSPAKTDDEIEAIVEQRLSVERERCRTYQKPNNSNGKGGRPVPRFGSTTTKFATGAVRTSKSDFLSLYDYGGPEDHNHDGGGEDALILYSSRSAMPSDDAKADYAMYDYGNGIPSVSAADATENCENMNVIVVNARKSKQCTVITYGYENYHVQRWMRINEVDGGPLVQDLPLVHVGRGMQDNGRDQFVPPDKFQSNKAMDMLKSHLNGLDDKKIKSATKGIAKDNTIIVMVCNKGQSDLLMNFACNAKSRGLDISNVLVFATDEGTEDIAKGLGFATFYDNAMFGKLPSEEAKRYGDRTFTAMMYAKVVTVQLVLMQGYDVLFQDVDIVWYKNPLDFFHDKSSPLQRFDVLLQDDGARTVRYAPFSGNSGFYYVRSNHKTRHLFNTLLFSAALILKTGSHQQVLGALLAEHSALFGLHVKTLDGASFPGGYHYHRDKGLMRDIAKGTKTPWLFHMSWTTNKDNKVLFFKQMGLWHIKEQCEKLDSMVATRSVTADSCCSTEPLVSCHFKDKPSIKPCPDSPLIDQWGKSFW